MGRIILKLLVWYESPSATKKMLDLKEKKVIEETENGKDVPANGNNGEPENEVDEEDDDVGEEDDEEDDGEGDEDEDDEEAEGGTGKRAAEDDDDEVCTQKGLSPISRT
uniref:Prothymosin alpha-like n=1 Tax=Scleropages formosus TaxID=113540 RepID=A0A8C9V6R4_SCLFO